MVIIFLALAVMLLLLWGIVTYNQLVRERMKVQTQWSQIDVVLKQRFDLIPNLVQTVKGYAAHERQTIQAVIDARAGYLGAASADAQIKASAELTGAVGRLLALAESYPELKANQNFIHLQQQVTALEEKLADYRQFYNDMVLRYNSLLATVPTNLIAGLFHFEAAEYLKVEEGERAPVSIEF